MVFSLFSSPSPLRLEPEDFLLVSTPMDKFTAMLGGGAGGITPTAPGVTPAPTSHTIAQTGRGGGVVGSLQSLYNPPFSKSLHEGAFGEKKTLVLVSLRVNFVIESHGSQFVHHRTICYVNVAESS